MLLALIYLITTLFNLYAMVVILRAWLQLVDADFYNPVSQVSIKLTSPIVPLLQRIIPSIGRADLASIFFAYLLTVIKLSAVLAIYGQSILTFLPQILALSLVGLIRLIGSLLFWVLMIRAILSWINQSNNPLKYAIIQLTEPLLMPVRRIIPPIGGLDLSILIVFIALQFFNAILSSLVGNLWSLPVI